MLENLVIEVVRKYKPARSILHSIIYLYNNNVLTDWVLTITGVYSESLDREIEKLIKEGSIRQCPDGRLTLDTCQGVDENLLEFVDRAVRKYVKEYLNSSPEPQQARI
ncbi:hypothetical protein ACSU1N_05605 [Thermogladius sp. 4427co]|uniref:hypothetical protein n=1 Tax=Thermogladius sp. 4427co TaxID=3450718 RepID=UPI003F78C502